ncbi:hypothetical protein SAMN05216489_06964 [Streptomyces sp. 3213]|nr:hypothetical protein SAMN05216489_06964 [Streptomyces sp. 3213] [Streptomyces sp. 3213.3]
MTDGAQTLPAAVQLMVENLRSIESFLRTRHLWKAGRRRIGGEPSLNCRRPTCSSSSLGSRRAGFSRREISSRPLTAPTPTGRSGWPSTGPSSSKPPAASVHPPQKTQSARRRDAVASAAGLRGSLPCRVRHRRRARCPRRRGRSGFQRRYRPERSGPHRKRPPGGRPARTVGHHGRRATTPGAGGRLSPRASASALTPAVATSVGTVCRSLTAPACRTCRVGNSPPFQDW